MTAENQQRYRSIGIIGGGTAGYMAALAFQKNIPGIKVTVVESPHIPIIGVGEATTLPIVNFLHKHLQIDPKRFYKEVQPTWKLGIKYEWGFPGDYSFNYPFEVIDSYVGKFGMGDLNKGSIISRLMDEDKSFVLKGTQDGNHRIIGKGNYYAYHLENKAFNAFLHQELLNSGIEVIRTTIEKVKRSENSLSLESVIDDAGRSFVFDLFVDCTGFKSKLLGETMESPFISYTPSVFTNKAWVGSVSNHGHIKPYTLATTMENGWKWTIPLRHADHVGYVFSNAFCSEESALVELKRAHPDLKNPKLVSFESGRRKNCWVGNVLAFGNSYGFLEPLASTGVEMIMTSIKRIIENFPKSKSDYESVDRINSTLGETWDSIRWYLTLHFRFNKRKNTEFWRACQTDSDISGLEELLHFYKTEGPFMLNEKVRTGQAEHIVRNQSFPRFNAYEILLVGQGIYPDKPVDIKRQTQELSLKNQLWDKTCAMALPLSKALPLVDKHPEILKL